MMVWILCFFLTGSLPDPPLAEWDRFEKAVRDQTIQKEVAKRQFPVLYADLKSLCSALPFAHHAAWIFPVHGYGMKDVGAGGFKPNIRYGSVPVRGYDFYDGNRHGGHPAYDIFIRDKNRDSLDDRGEKPVTVLAPADLLILSTEGGWKAGSEIRGGNYIWALDPLKDHFFYFAHLNELHVRAGDFCRAGSEIGTVGRTGKNAYPAPSPTHLHLMVLAIKSGGFIPVDYLSFFEK